VALFSGFDVKTFGLIPNSQESFHTTSGARVLYLRMTKHCSNSITRTRWDEAAADYELGHKHAVQIARELGVSPATVSREFKRRGCIKASRIAETFAAIEARLDAEAEARARSKVVRDEARTRALSALVDELMDVIEAAGENGDLTTANPDIARIDRALQIAMR